MPKTLCAGVDSGFGFIKIIAKDSDGKVYKMRIQSVISPADKNFSVLMSHLQKERWHRGNRSWVPGYKEFFEQTYFNSPGMQFEEFMIGMPNSDGRVNQSQLSTDWNSPSRRSTIYGVMAFLASLADNSDKEGEKDGEIFLCSGLPNEVYNNNENLRDYQKYMDNLHNFMVYQENINDTGNPTKRFLEANIRDHIIMAQSDGAFLVETKLPTDYTYLLIVDVGFGTVNLTLLSSDPLTPNVYYTEWKGVGNALVDNIQRKIRSEIGGTIPLTRILGMIEGTSPKELPKQDPSTSHSSTFDVSEILSQEIAAYSMQINEIIERFIQQQKVSPLIYLSGGGSQIVGDAVKAVHQNVYITADPVYGNAKGFFMTALHSAEDSGIILPSATVKTAAVS